MLIAATVAAGCTRHVTVAAPREIAVYYCKAGTGDLVRIPYSVDPKMSDADVRAYALSQLSAGPSVGRDSVVLFPSDTQATVTSQGTTAIVDVKGGMTRAFRGGASDEAGIFKSLTYTLTGLPGIARVQVLVAGRKLGALPGGHFEIDEPLTRETFAQ